MPTGVKAITGQISRAKANEFIEIFRSRDDLQEAFDEAAPNSHITIYPGDYTGKGSFTVKPNVYSTILPGANVSEAQIQGARENVKNLNKSFFDPVWNADNIQSQPVTDSEPNENDLLVYDSGTWEVKQVSEIPDLLLGRTTDTLDEGSANLYYTDERVEGVLGAVEIEISAGLGLVQGGTLTLDTGGEIALAVDFDELDLRYMSATGAGFVPVTGGSFTGNVFFEENVNVQGVFINPTVFDDGVTVNGSFDAVGPAVFDDSVIVQGNFTVNGTTTVVNSTEVDIGDNILRLNAGHTGTPTQNGGIEIERGSASNAILRWNESSEAWEFGTDGNFSEIGDTTGLIAEGDDVSLLNNDAGYLTSIPATVIEEGDNVSLLTNDAGYITSATIDSNWDVAYDRSPTGLSVSASGRTVSITLNRENASNLSSSNSFGQFGVTDVTFTDQNLLESSNVQFARIDSSTIFRNTSASDNSNNEFRRSRISFSSPTISEISDLTNSGSNQSTDWSFADSNQMIIAGGTGVNVEAMAFIIPANTTEAAIQVGRLGLNTDIGTLHLNPLGSEVRTGGNMFVDGDLEITGNLIGATAGGGGDPVTAVSLSGDGNSSLSVEITLDSGATISDSTSTSHNHSAGDITSGTLSTARLPTITTSEVDFTNQQLSTTSSTRFGRLGVNTSAPTGDTRFEVNGDAKINGELEADALILPSA